MSINTLTITKTSLFHEKAEDFFSQWPLNEDSDTRIVKTDDGYELSILLPGMKREQIEVGIMDNILCVTGNRESATGIDDRYTLCETLSFRRNFRMPDEIDLNNVGTRYEQGVLKLILRDKKSQ